MKTDSLLKAYEYIENRCLRYRLPGDQWIAEGVIRVNVSALQRAIRYEPEFFIFEEKKGDRNRAGELSENQLIIQYGPEDWRLIDSWNVRPAGRWKVSSTALLSFLWEEEDVKRYLARWNYVVSYQERRERMSGRNKAEEEAAASWPYEASAAPVGLSDQVWEAIMAAAPSAVITADFSGGSRLPQGKNWETERTVPAPVELMTRSGRWFGIYRKQEQLYICEARHMTPGCPLTFDRRIRRKEVDALLPLYGKWATAADEELIRGQARQISISYEYIFTMIRQYATG